MTIKALHLGLKCTEVPIDFYKDQAGRQSHMKRSGWLEPWRAGWPILEAIFVYGVDFFVFRPGLILLTASLALMLPLTFGPIDLGWVYFQVNWMLLAMSLSLLGLSLVYFGGIVQVLLDEDGHNWRRSDRVFPYNRTLALCGGMGLIGLALLVPILVTYIRHGGRPFAPSNPTHPPLPRPLVLLPRFPTFLFLPLSPGRALGAAPPPGMPPV